MQGRQQPTTLVWVLHGAIWMGANNALRCWIIWKAQFIHKSARIHLGDCSENIDSDKPTDSKLQSEIQSTCPFGKIKTLGMFCNNSHLCVSELKRTVCLSSTFQTMCLKFEKGCWKLAFGNVTKALIPLTA